MTLGRSLFFVGAFGLGSSVLVLAQLSEFGSLRGRVGTGSINLMLYGFPGFIGLWSALVVASRRLSPMSRMIFSHGSAILSVFWVILWCFVWLAMMAGYGDKAEMFIKHSAYLHLFGVGFSMAGYATGWMASRLDLRTLRFLMTSGWAASYMAWFNLYLHPELSFLWAAAVGGLLVVLGGFLMERTLKREVEGKSWVA